MRTWGLRVGTEGSHGVLLLGSSCAVNVPSLRSLLLCTESLRIPIPPPEPTGVPTERSVAPNEGGTAHPIAPHTEILGRNEAEKQRQSWGLMVHADTARSWGALRDDLPFSAQR